jgi:hypothetical protein
MCIPFQNLFVLLLPMELVQAPANLPNTKVHPTQPPNKQFTFLPVRNRINTCKNTFREVECLANTELSQISSRDDMERRHQLFE